MEVTGKQVFEWFLAGVGSLAAFLLSAGVIISRTKIVKEWYNMVRLQSCPNRAMVLANFGETIISRCEKAIHQGYLDDNMRARLITLYKLYQDNKGNGNVVSDYVERAKALPPEPPESGYTGPERRGNGIYL